MPENPDVGLPGVAIDPPTPATIVHVPDPDVAGLPAKVAETPHTFWSGPALATVGAPVNVITTSSMDVGQGELAIFQRKV